MSVLATTHYMDEAEYCSRVGLMKDGKLLALDRPGELKKKVLKGSAWDIASSSLQQTLALIEKVPQVVQTSLLGDLIHVIIKKGADNTCLEEADCNARQD